MILVQVLVLVFTGALWWIARRDLASRLPLPAPPPEAADTADLEQLCATLETLVTSLAHRLEYVERQIAARPLTAETQSREVRNAEAANAERDISAPSLPASARTVLSVPVPTALPVPAPRIVPEPVPDPRYEPVYALLEAGVTDPAEIARQTGLGRGEVDLILSLHRRSAF